MSSKIRPAGYAARGAMYTLRAGGNGSLPNEVRVTGMQSAISIDPFCQGVLRVRLRSLRNWIDRPASIQTLLTRFRRVAEDQPGVSSAMGWLQGLVSSERDGYIENRRGAKRARNVLSPRKTRNTRKGGKRPSDFNAILSCVSCLSWLAQLTIEETSGDVTAYSLNGDQCTLDGCLFYLDTFYAF